ncbi:LacI family DNA-binding transcriptional regulator [Alteribacillus sp. HJP-4]|uniref:LacI family DNA-binding transcriptional regulator n=1 Tax=Alteribacillus sp. HJP-4 TaxID=2775394 RepID=UPI0035CD3A27
MAATIKDVAKRANVSPSTVSRVISNSSRISQATKDRVRKIMKELGYHPNYNARSLANQHTKTIGIIMPRSAKVAFQNPFFPEVIRGISMKARQEGYGLYLSTGQTEEEIYEEVMHMVEGSRVDGIILLYSKMNDTIMPYLMEKEFPFVLIGRPYDMPPGQVTHVDNDNVKAAKMVTEYLTLLGHTQIAFIGGDSEYVVTVDHLDGYKAALERSGLPVYDEYIVYNDELEEGGQEAIIELMSLTDPPSALVVADDIMTFGVLRMLYEMDVKVPDQLSVVSFNNVMISELSSPPMTTVDIHIVDLGSKAAQLLFDKIKQPELGPQRLLVPHKLIKRQSCRKLAAKEIQSQ